MQEIKEIIESLLFVAEEPLTVEKLRAILETAETKEIHNALKALSEEYDQRGGGFMLREVAGGWQIRSRPEYNEWIKRMLQPSPQRLSRAALETLAVIAYKQPIIRADIEHIRGVDCGGVLRQLMERKIIRVLGRKEIAGRPLIYATTKLFLEMFDLKDLNDLPTPKEIAELGNAMIDSQRTDASEQLPPQQDEAADQAAAAQEDTDPSIAEAETDPSVPMTTTEPIPADPSQEDAPSPRETPGEPEAEKYDGAALDEAAEFPEGLDDGAVAEPDYMAESQQEENTLPEEDASETPEPDSDDDSEPDNPNETDDDDGLEQNVSGQESKNS